MKKIPVFLCFIFLSTASFSNTIVDVYGANKTHTETILKKYSNQVIEIESEQVKQLQDEVITDKKNIKTFEKLQTRKEKLIEDIKKEGDFLYVAFDTVSYSDKKNLYTTIEIIENKQSLRLKFIDPHVNKKKHHVHSMLIDKMIEYDNLILNQLDTDAYTTCPVYHCTSGFNHQALKPYLKVFNAGVIKEKNQILDVLNNDSDSERRAAAAFLLGHLQNPEEIISILEKHVNDKNRHVRNNAMRVIAATMQKANIDTINITPYINLLNSPYVTDRNKALAILASASKNRALQSLIIKKSKDNLVKLLELKQPINHNWAYDVLKQISGKNYGEYDVNAWKNWLTAAQKA